METRISKISELDKERNKLKIASDDHLNELGKSLKTVKGKSKMALVNKILIPAGAAILVGYGIKKLVDILQSDDEEDKQVATHGNYEDESSHHQQSQSEHHQEKGGLFSNIGWAAIAVRLIPFIIGVGQRMYEDSNLPFFGSPAEAKNPDVVEEV